jgi:nickel/cobalt transporter (NicO) family protein
MRVAGLILAALAAAGLLALLLPAEGPLARAAVQAQAEFQNALAGLLRALRAGDMAALAGLLGVAFAYGFLHAAGPGHGKALLAGYGVARRVAALRLMLLALVAALAQATVAVVLVLGLAALFELTRAQLLAIEADVVPVFASIALGLIGVWLVWRGAAALRRRWRPVDAHVHVHVHGNAHGHSHNHSHGTGDVCGDCGHRHGPSLAEVAALRSPWEAVLLVAAIAARPCSGALILLFLTIRMDIVWAGILGTYAMALGTALVTAGVGWLAALSREGALGVSDRMGRTAAILPWAELALGGAILWVALRGLGV